MARLIWVAIFSFVSALSLAPAIGWAQETAADMPIADLHFHPGERGKTPADVRPAFDRSGVRWFGLGAVAGPNVMPDFFRAFGDRLIVWAGQAGMEQIRFKGGMGEIENPANPDFRQLLRNMEDAFAGRKIVGIGELFVNNRSAVPGNNPRKMVIDGPVVRPLFELAAKYNAFVAFHMEADADSIAQLERLAASDRKGRIILNHCAVNITPAELDRLFDDHPNLFCEFSVRYPPVRPPNNLYTEMFNNASIAAGWKDVIVKHPDRFMVGTDASGDNDRYVRSIQNVRSGLLANLPVEVARKVAYGNAKELFGLK
jgi:hypothetical protein